MEAAAERGEDLVLPLAFVCRLVKVGFEICQVVVKLVEDPLSEICLGEELLQIYLRKLHLADKRTDDHSCLVAYFALAGRCNPSFFLPQIW